MSTRSRKTGTIRMLDFLIDNIYAFFGGGGWCLAALQSATFNFTYRYTNEVCWLCWFLNELAIENTIDTARSALYIDRYQENDNEGWLRTTNLISISHCTLSIHIYIYIYTNIRVALTYEVYLFQLIRYSRAWDSYHDFLDRVLLATMKLLNKRVPDG